MFRRLLTTFLITLLLLILVAAPVLAASYYATYSVQETSGNSYTMLAVVNTSPAALNNSWMASNGYMESTALDTRVQTVSGTAQPHMVADDKTLTAIAVGANTTTNLQFTTGNADLTSMPIITGYGGYVTTLDAAALEPGNNFQFDHSGYVSTASGTGKNLVYKQYAYRTFISAASTIKSQIYGALNLTQLNVGSWNAVWNGATTRIGQHFTSLDETNITAVQFYLEQILAPAGTGYARVYRVSDDFLMGTIGSVNVATIGAAGWVTFNASAVAIPQGESIYLVFEYTGGDAANHVRVYFDAANTITGNYVTYDGTYHDAAGSDVAIQLAWTTPDKTVTAAAVASGTHVIRTTADAANFKIFVDNMGAAVDTVALAGSTVPDNANNWIIANGNVAPYLDYYKETIGGTLTVWYQPVTMILTTVLPDRQGAAQNGAITWGTNPAGVTVTVGSMTSTSQTTAGTTTSTGSRDLLPKAEVSNWYATPAVGGSLATNPLRPFVQTMTLGGTVTESLAWKFFGLVFVLGVVMSVHKALRGHLGISMIAGCAACVSLVALTVWPTWALVFAVIMFVGGLVLERSPVM